MKKISILAIAAMAMVSCGNTYTAKQVTLTNMNDSINYSLGLLNGANIKTYRLAADSSKEAVAEFMDALVQAYEGKTEANDSRAVEMGHNIGIATKAYEKTGLVDNKAWTLNEKLVFQGLINALYDDTIVMKAEDARNFFYSEYRLSRRDTVNKAGKAIVGKCPKAAKVVKLANKVDSLNYAFGMFNGADLKMYILANDSDGVETKALIAAINEGLKMNVRNPQIVEMGKEIGQMIREQEADGLMGEPSLITDFELIKQGFINGLNQYFDQWALEDAGEYIQTTMDNLKYGNVKAASEQFMAQNALKDGVITTASGLQYEVIKMGKGAKPAADSRVKVHYVGTLIDGTQFDSSIDRGEPAVFGVNQVIKGWTEGLQLMPVGSKFKFYIPSELGYGERGTGGSIPPYAALIFEVELLGIEK